MKLGVSSYMFRWAIGTAQFRPARPLTPIDLIEAAADLGVQRLQLSDQPLLEACEPSALLRIRSVAEARGVALEIGTTGCEPARLERYRTMALRLGVCLVRLVLDGEGTPMRRERAIATLRACAPAFGAARIMIAIENHFLMTSAELIEIIEQVDSPTVRVCLDTANSIGAQEWPEETIRLLAPFAVNVHLKDYIIAPHPEGVGVVISGAPLGQGRLNIPALLDVLGALDQQPTITLEQWSPRQENEAATLELERAWARSSVAAARAYLAAAPFGPAPV